MPTTNVLTTQLDRIEATLPTVPAKMFHLQRALTGAAVGRTAAVATLVAGSTKDFLVTARTAGRTVTGQARAAADDVATSVRTGTKTVAGQSTAQGRRVSKAASTGATDLLDRGIDAVEDQPGSGTPYEQWTKAELVERAKELDLDGRSGLSKAQLIKALRNA